MSDTDDSVLEFERHSNSNYQRQSCLASSSSSSDSDSSFEVLFNATKKPYVWGNRNMTDMVRDLSEDDHKRLFRMLPTTFESLFDEIWYEFPKLGLSSNGKSISIRKVLI